MLSPPRPARARSRFDGASTQDACNISTYSGSGESESYGCANGTYASRPRSAGCKSRGREEGSYVPDDADLETDPVRRGLLLAGSRCQQVHCMFALKRNAQRRRHEVRGCSGWVHCADSQATRARLAARSARPASTRRRTWPVGPLPAKPGEYVPEDGWSKEPEECKAGETDRSALASSCDECEDQLLRRNTGIAELRACRSATSRKMIESDSSSARSAVTRRAQGRTTCASLVRWVRLPPPRV